MLAARQPLGTLDSNVPRVQPSRAAKTDHKWLGKKHNKNSQNDNCFPGLLGCAQLNKAMSSNGSHESFGQENSNTNSYTRGQNQFPRLPLSVIENNSRNLEDNDQKATHKGRFPPIRQQPLSGSGTINMDTSSDSSYRSLPESELSQESGIGFSQKFPISTGKAKRQGRCYGGKADVRFDYSDEYCVDIMQCLRKSEVQYAPSACYLSDQTEITAPMRVKLVDWLVEVQDEYKLHNETLHLAVAYVDRFLSTMSVTRAKLQLLGTTCMFLAAKFEEIYPPDADEFAYVTADTYSRAEVLMMERIILKVFDYKLVVPTCHQFLDLFGDKAKVGHELRSLSNYLGELMLLDEVYLKFLPSVRAAASLTLAHATIRHVRGPAANLNGYSLGDATAQCREFPGTKSCVAREVSRFCAGRLELTSSLRDPMRSSLTELYECVHMLAKTHRLEAEKQSFVYEKHSSSKYKNVAALTALHSGATTIATAGLSWDSIVALWTT